MAALPCVTDSLFTVENRIATLTLNRDDLRNALTGTALVDDIAAVVGWANATPEISVLIITGVGAAFCAGGNVKDMAKRGGAFAGSVPEVEYRYRHGIQRIPLAIHGAEMPVIAALNGAAIGAGCDLACMCDLRVASTRASIGETFVNLGIIPGDGGAWFLQRLLGYQRAAELTFTGRVIEAQEAHAIGLFLEVVDHKELMSRTLEIAGEMARKPPQALRYAKRLMKAAQRLELTDFLDLCALVQGICHNTDDHVEAVKAFVEKRAPEFSGQ